MAGKLTLNSGMSELPVSPNAGNLKQFLLFGQRESLFAVDLLSVREVLFLGQQPIAPVPNTRHFVLGLTNLRGEILAVADFGRFLRTEGVDSHSVHSRILILEAPDPRDGNLVMMRMGLAVSRVQGVISVHLERMVSSMDVGEELAPFLRGLYDWTGRLVMILDVEAIAQSEGW
ncbi:chemotaxis protein CheW [Laspinema palackyanum]|uniref:chemotaxis protein CheW n=1 Tax=Laspinema palackyanum TaxID=3231601 RepID=UPI00345D4F2B|nr:chemotaxis protein CheW [Laspinema sp. D2c]